MAGGFRGLWDLVGPSAGTGTAVAAGPAVTVPQRRSGTIPSAVAGADRRKDISRRAGEANTEDLAWGIGQPQNGARAGKHNAVWAFLNISAGAGNYDISHALGSRPVAVELVDVRYPVGGTPPDVGFQPIRQDEWTDTMVKVRMVVRSGVTTRCTARLIVRGA